MEIKDAVELVVRMCKKSDYEEEYDPLWLKRPFVFSRKNLKREQIYRRTLKYLYNHVYDGARRDLELFQPKLWRNTLKKC